VLQVAKLVHFQGFQLSALFLLLSWSLVAVVVSLTRPRACPVSLVAVYSSTFVAEAAVLQTCSFPPPVQEGLAQGGAILIIISIALLMAMPMHIAAPRSTPISVVGTVPSDVERSPEDRLRLYQFLIVSWVSPLLAVGKKRQLQKEDVWELPYVFQTARLAQRFRDVKGHVLVRLFKSNGLDCIILVAFAFIQLVFGGHSAFEMDVLS
jgi:hypothetical protein